MGAMLAVGVFCEKESFRSLPISPFASLNRALAVVGAWLEDVVGLVSSLRRPLDSDWLKDGESSIPRSRIRPDVDGARTSPLVLEASGTGVDRSDL